MLASQSNEEKISNQGLLVNMEKVNIIAIFNKVTKTGIVLSYVVQ